MATYAQVLAKIRAALSLRPANTKVTVAKHEEAEIAILDYIEQQTAYTAKYNSPFNGTANTILAMAIKHFAVREIEDQLYLYLAEITAGYWDGTDYNYEILIMKGGADLSDSQTSTPAFTFTAKVRNPYSGPIGCILSEVDGSGRYGNMVVDWSALTLGETYTCQSYSEGSLFAYSLISDMGAIGGGVSFLKREGFVAVANQTVFTPSKFRLTEDALVIINQSIQDPSTYVISGNTITFNTPCTVDDSVAILN